MKNGTFAHIYSTLMSQLRALACLWAYTVHRPSLAVVVEKNDVNIIPFWVALEALMVSATTLSPLQYENGRGWSSYSAMIDNYGHIILPLSFLLAGTFSLHRSDIPQIEGDKYVINQAKGLWAPTGVICHAAAAQYSSLDCELERGHGTR